MKPELARQVTSVSASVHPAASFEGDMTKRVLVAMSGGVDSSVTAALLKRQGFDVAGITMKLTAGRCCDIGAAQAVCRHLGIEHRIIDAQDEFSREVVSNFISEYRQGRTPNPCIRCNDLVKFTYLLHYAQINKFDFLATGHYARIESDPVSAGIVLKKGIDENKDQSYFLYRLTQAQMRSLLLPLGGMRKTEVRERALALGLPTAERPESQEICFVADNDYRSFLREHAPETVRPGDITLADGTVVGKHDGIAFFTIGQRRHLGVAAGERRYVVRIEPGSNRIILGRHDELQVGEMTVSHIQGPETDSLARESTIQVKIRYRSQLFPAEVKAVGSDTVLVKFAQRVAGICPGQAAVFYAGDRVLGGGIIGPRTGYTAV